MRKNVKWISLCMALLMLLGMFPLAVSAVIDTMVVGDQKDVTIATAGQMVDFHFTPTETGLYRFYSFDYNIDPYGYILQGDDLIRGNNDYQYNADFRVEAQLTQGVQYTLRAKATDETAVGSFKVGLKKLEKATAMTVFDADSINMNIGGHYGLYPNFNSDDVIIEEVEYTVSANGYLKIYENYFVAVKAGKVTITAISENGLRDSMEVTIFPSQPIYAGNSMYLSDINDPAPTYAFVAPESAVYTVYSTGEGDPCITVYDSDFNEIAHSDDEINLMFHATFAAEQGKTYYLSLYTYHNGGFYTLHLEKTPATGGIKANYNEYIGYVGENIYPAFAPVPAAYDADIYGMTYSSANTEVVCVVGEDEDVLECVGIGTATITATNSDGLQTTFVIKVIAPQVITEEGYVDFVSSENHYVHKYAYTPAQSGVYLIDVVGQNSYIDVLAPQVSDGEYQLTQGETYYINAESMQGTAARFYVFKDTTTFCGNSEHTWGNYELGQNATTLTVGVRLRVCKKCGETDWEILEPISSKKDTDKQFGDIKKDWYYAAVDFAYNSNLFTGITTTQFSPDGKMSRAMFVTVLGRLTGVEVNNNITTRFTDVKKGEYYTGYVDWASRYGIVNGISDTKFDPNSNISREQICVMMVRYMEFSGICLRNDSPAVTFKDSAKIAGWAKDAVTACQRGGIINGIKVSGGYEFDPTGHATRAQVATIIYNYVQNYLVREYSNLGGMGGNAW